MNEAIEVVLSERRKLEETSGANPDSIKHLRSQGIDLIHGKIKKMMPVIDTLKNPYVSLLTFQFNFPDDSAFCMKMNSRYQREIPHSKYAGQFFDALYDTYFTLPIGSFAPDISLPDKNGETLKLSGFRGSYVLLDFWASWCHPCRIENEEIMKPLYKKYGNSHFAIFSVSMDKDKAAWLQALETDHLNWTEVCDTKSFNSDAARLYKLTNSVPAIYVIDPAGKIIAKNIHNKELENFITKKMDGK